MATTRRRSAGQARQTKAQGPHDPSEGQATKPPKAAKPPRAKTASPKPAAQAKPGGAAASKRVTKPPVARNALDAANAVKPIAERIANGQTYRQIAADVGVGLGALTAWLDADSERSQAHARAREISAQTFDELAEKEIRDAGDPFELAKARELATHFRWRAKAVNPKRYGDKVDVTQQLTIKEVPDDELLARAAKLTALLAGKGAGSA